MGAVVTEDEWTTATNPKLLLKSALKDLPLRKQVLLAAAATRLLDEHLTDPRARDALATIERHHDQLDHDDERYRACVDAIHAIQTEQTRLMVAAGDRWGPQAESYAAVAALAVATAGTNPISLWDVVQFIEQGCFKNAHGTARRKKRSAIRKRLCGVIREVIGNPLRTFMTAPPWMGRGTTQPDGKFVPFTDTVASLAAAIHEGGHYDRLPILADALQDAGVDDADLLAHCRSDTTHSRGCWALDVALCRG